MQEDFGLVLKCNKHRGRGRGGNIWVNGNDSNLRKARKAAGVTALELATEIDVSEGELCEIELRTASVWNHQVETLSKILQVDIDYIKEGLSIADGKSRSVMRCRSK
jgi:transcriptional regulator with XRE-family HTH domain